MLLLKCLRIWHFAQEDRLDFPIGIDTPGLADAKVPQTMELYARRGSHVGTNRNTHRCWISNHAVAIRLRCFRLRSANLNREARMACQSGNRIFQQDRVQLIGTGGSIHCQ